MKHRRHAQRTQLSRLKHLIADMFRMDILEPDNIADDVPLIGGSLGLDSLDALELSICIEEMFGVAIYNMDRAPRAFASIASLADFIRISTQPKHTRLFNRSDDLIPLEVLTSPSPI